MQGKLKLTGKEFKERVDKQLKASCLKYPNWLRLKITELQNSVHMSYDTIMYVYIVLAISLGYLCDTYIFLVDCLTKRFYSMSPTS